MITLEKGTAEISGQVMGKDQKPAIAVQVIVLNARHEMARTGQTDAQGHYSIRSIRELPPGDYRLATGAEKITLAHSANETRQLEIR